MKILAIDSSGMTASVAVIEDDKVAAELNINNKKTHSQTLLPMIETLTKYLELELETLDAIAVTKGPGSFTGLRIGSATAKGLALALKLPIVEISTLEAMAYAFFGTGKLICPMMDARRAQVYTGLYRFRNEEFVNVMPDCAVSVDELLGALNEKCDPVIFTGDGVPVYREFIKEKLRIPYEFAPAFQNRQRAAILGVLAVKYAKEGRLTPAEKHRPTYLRLSQAERERMERCNG